MLNFVKEIIAGNKEIVPQKGNYKSFTQRTENPPSL